VALVAEEPERGAARGEGASEGGGAYAAIADLALAAAAFEDGDRAAAWKRLARVPDASHPAAQRDALAGTLLAAEGRREEAARALEASLARNRAQLETVDQAIELYEALGDPARARARETQPGGPAPAVRAARGAGSAAALSSLSASSPARPASRPCALRRTPPA
jgi:hypothetical protein